MSNTLTEEDLLNLLKDNNFKKMTEATNLHDIIIEENYVIHLLAVRGNEAGLDFFIKNKIDVTYTNYKGQNIIHILFKYGYDDLAEKYYKLYPDLLNKLDNDITLPFFYCVDRYNNFYKCFRFMKEQKYDMYKLLNIVSVYDDNIVTRLIIFSENKNKSIKVYIKFLTDNIDLLNFELPQKNPLLTYAILTDRNDIAHVFIENKKGIDIKNYMFLLPINAACSKNNLAIVKHILKQDDNITYGGGDSEYLPVNIAINNNLFDLLNLLIEHIKEYNIIDRYRNIYAHYIADRLIFFVINNLILEERKLRNISFKILENSDIDLENNDKISVRKLLSQYIKLKEKQKKSQKINKDEDKKDVFDIKDIKLIVNNIDTSTTEDEYKERHFVLVKSKKHFNSGLFGADIFYKTLYILYLHNKYDDLCIPTQKLSDDKIKKMLYLINMQTINYSAYYNIITSIYYTTLKYLTPILPSNILWHSKDLHYINPDLFDIIKKTKKRFILLTISLIVAKEFTHANCIIIDTKKNDIRRFEPYGLNTMGDENELDELIKNKCEEIFNRKFRYYKPEDYVGNIKFQSVSNDGNNNYRKLGDPMGYCLAWCMWFIELKLNNPDIKDSELTNLASENILKYYKKYDNPYLYFIRDYGRILNDEKDKIFRKIKISKDELYDINYKQTNLYKIHDYIQKYNFE